MLSQALLVSSAGLCHLTQPLCQPGHGAAPAPQGSPGLQAGSRGRAGVGLKAAQSNVGDSQFSALWGELFPCENPNHRSLRQRPNPSLGEGAWPARAAWRGSGGTGRAVRWHWLAGSVLWPLPRVWSCPGWGGCSELPFPARCRHCQVPPVRHCQAHCLSLCSRVLLRSPGCPPARPCAAFTHLCCSWCSGDEQG